MEYITTKDAAKRFKKSISTIKRLVAVAPDSSLRYEPNRTAHNRRLFISLEYLEGKLSDSRTAPDNIPQDTTVSILAKELDNKQKIIDSLLERQKELIAAHSLLLENESKMQLLLDRSEMRNQLLNQHFDANRKKNHKYATSEEIEIEEIIDSVEEEEVIDSIEEVIEDIDTSEIKERTESEWLKFYSSNG